MTQTLFASYDHMALLADYRTPQMHAHLCSHFALALDGTLHCTTDRETFDAQGVFIDSNVTHTLECDGPRLIYFFDEVSALGAQIKSLYLNKADTAKASSELVAQSRSVLQRFAQNPNSEAFDQEMMALLLGNTAPLVLKKTASVDPRIIDVLDYLQNLESVPGTVIDDLASLVCLSKSRLSHLFTQEMGVSLHRYLAFVKMKKAAELIACGSSLTDAAIKAGFDSSSHLSSTVKRMFGISLTDVMRSMRS